MRPGERSIAVMLVLSIGGSLALTAVYAAGGQPQLEGILLAVALGALGAAIIAWALRLLPHEAVTDVREPEPSPAEIRAAATTAFARGEEQLTGRRTLGRLLLGALAGLALVALFPIRSLGPRPGRSMFHTEWQPGSFLVDGAGRRVRDGELAVGSVITVFPDGYVGSPVSQTLLIRVEPDQLRLPAGRGGWAPKGYVAFSKICTHAGCPVGLYRAAAHQLLCPCHQSTFDVLRGAAPIFGPTTRALPQLPLRIDADGYLRATGDFSAPVGPGFWELSS
ncbi:MAG TPA: Rieske (2Fe-2S) protein [bacterium]|nr:Rieske (2Fe-2S) protein [bacterium]